jgi:hypothetical protein
MRKSGYGKFCTTLPVKPASAMAKSNYNDPLEEFVTVTSVWRLRVMARRYAGQARKEVLAAVALKKTLLYNPPRGGSLNGYQAECLETAITVDSFPSSLYPDW